MAESQKHYADQETSGKKRVYTVRFHLYESLEEINLIYSDRKPISDCQAAKGNDGLSGMTEMFNILTIMVVTQIPMFVQMNLSVHLK